MRKVFTTFFVLLIAITSWGEIDRGLCGTIIWILEDDCTLTFIGDGEMMDYSSSEYSPWYSHKYNISKVIIGDEITNIGNYAFRECYNLTSVTIGNSVTSIGESAFTDCTNLTSVEIPNSVKSIGKNAFGSCPGLTSVTIGNSVTSIGDGAFHGSRLTSVTIGSSVKSIGEKAFSMCSDLTSVTIPGSVTSIGNWAFEGCSGLTSITIPGSVTSIGIWAFSGCSHLTSVTIPSSMTSIGNMAFFGCARITAINVDTENKNYCSIDGVLYDKNVTTIINCPIKHGAKSYDIPSSVTNIGCAAFAGCSDLNSVTIPNSVKSIGWNAFGSCSGLNSVTIPNSVTNIEENAFCGCSGLTSVTIGNSVTNIGESAFSECSALTSVTCLANKVPETSDYVFLRSLLSSMTLNIPSGSLENYKATSPWSEFGTILPLKEETPVEKCATPKIIYSGNKLTFSCDTEGATVNCTIAPSDTKTVKVKISEQTGITLKPQYTISCYATAEGYAQSETATKEIEIVTGDVNGDGNLDITDVPLLIKRILEK